MRRLWTLAVVAILGVTTAGCLRDFEDPHFVRVTDVDLAPARVASQQVVLNVTTTLDNSGGGESDAVALLAKAYSSQTGFLLDESRLDIGTLAGDTTRTFAQELTVPRDGGVRVEVALFEDDKQHHGASVLAHNLGSLQPDALDTGLRISDIDFLVDNVTDPRRPLIRTDLYVTNEGEAPSEDLRVQVKARDLDTRLVTDIQWLTTGTVAPAATVIRSTNLSVAAERNYVFEIALWRGDTIVARDEGIVQLAPVLLKDEDDELVVDKPNLGELQFGRGVPTPSDPFSGGGSPAAEVPAPGAALALGAVAAAALVAAGRGRWRR